MFQFKSNSSKLQANRDDQFTAIAERKKQGERKDILPAIALFVKAKMKHIVTRMKYKAIRKGDISIMK